MTPDPRTWLELLRNIIIDKYYYSNLFKRRLVPTIKPLCNQHIYIIIRLADFCICLKFKLFAFYYLLSKEMNGMHIYISANIFTRILHKLIVILKQDGYNGHNNKL